MILKPLEDVTRSDIESLIQNQVREGRTIEYKKVLPGNSDEDKREFLADISSFANGGGGDLLYGISATDGIPKAASGLEGNLDAEVLRLDNLIRDGLDPRVHGLRMRAVEGFANGPVLLIRVPRSWASPHMITFKNLSRFFTRNSAGKHQMDVSEIRSGFLLSDTLPEKMRRFRDERLGRIIAGETPVVMRDGGKLVLHILPVVSFTSETKFDVSVLKAHATNGTSRLRPIGGTGWDERFNVDGFVTHSGARTGSGARSYSQIFRSGQIEAVSANHVREHEGKIFIVSIENDIVEAINEYIHILKALEIPGPLLVYLSLTGVSGAYMSVDRSRFFREPVPVDRDTLNLPDILIEDRAPLSNLNEVAKILRPAFDAVWNACGFERSYNYDNDGNWNPGR